MLATLNKRTTNLANPKQSRTNALQNDVAATRCPKCGSSRRAPYNCIRVIEAGGMFNGEPFDHVVIRYTRCLACGQSRVDRSHESGRPTVELLEPVE